MSYSKVEDPSILEELNKRSLKKVTDPNILKKLNKKDSQDDEFLQKPEESFLQKLPRNIAAGLAGLGHKTLNAPHDIAQSLQEKGKEFGGKLNLPGKQYGKSKDIDIASMIPKQEEHDFAQILGQEGSGTLSDQIIQKGIEYAPEIAGGAGIARAATRAIPLTARQIANRLSHHKTQARNTARQEYGGLFDEAANRGLTHSDIPQMNYNHIIEHSTPKYHEALQDFLEHPTLENAHWAQSDLGHLVRHLEKIEDNAKVTGGLTSTQNTTLRQARDAQNRIRQSMFGQNSLGAHPDLAENYQQLSQRYAQNVVPYNRLSALTDYEEGRMTPKNLIKNLRKDDQFMIEMAHRYPGLMAHSPAADWVKKGALGAVGFGSANSIFKKLLGK